MFTALRHRPFRWTASLYTAATFIEWFASIALMVIVYRQTQSTTVAAGLLLCKQVLPAVIVPLVGSALDRLHLARALPIALAIEAITITVIGFLGFGLWIFPLVVVAGAAAAVARATIRTATVRSLGPESLRAGNGVLNVSSAVCGLGGPALAAIAVSFMSADAVLLIAGAVLFLCAGAAHIAPRQAFDAPAAADSTDGVSPDDAPRRSGHSPVPVTWLLTLVGVVTCIFSMDDPALLAYSDTSLGAGVGGYGAIFAAWGLGVTAGSLLFSRLLDWPMLRVYALATTMAGAAYMALAVSPTIGIACLVAVFGGVGNGMDWVAIVTAVQEATPRGGEAKAARALESISMVGPGVGILAGGILADLTSPRLTLLVPGVLALAILLVGFAAVRLREERRRIGTQILSPSLPGGSV